MIILEQIMEIKILHKHGKSLRSITREVGVSVNTVSKYLKYDSSPKYKDRPKLVTKLAPYKDYLSDRIKSAHPVQQCVGYFSLGIAQLQIFVIFLSKLHNNLVDKISKSYIMPEVKTNGQ
ncbi:MAG: helix-turn-helix domain-containing protein [Rickettsia endosymbiont of Oxypoda opaca]|nr:helix-turn-helix domain-containing protein [Rickettsia endosymbiont of Oxypoda opaca]